MSKTKIDWVDGGETINPFTGCRGPNGVPCDFCYARKMARRLGGINRTVYERVKYATGHEDSETGIIDDYGDPFYPAIHLDVLDRQEARLVRGHKRVPSRNPRRIFVGSMGDFCFPDTAVTFDTNGERFPKALDWSTDRLQLELALFAERIAPHTVLLLTKRPDLLSVRVRWPANVHLGVSVTHNEDAAVRIPLLLEQLRGPALPWVSVEPLKDGDFEPRLLHGVKWVVVGVQSGQGTYHHRQAGFEKVGDEMVPVTHGEVLIQSAERIVEWCYDNKVPCFTKNNLRHLTHRYRPPMDWPRELP